jgi:hypothetical protein
MTTTKGGRPVLVVVVAFAFGYCLCLLQFGNADTLLSLSSATSTTKGNLYIHHENDDRLNLRHSTADDSQDNDDTPVMYRDDASDEGADDEGDDEVGDDALADERDDVDDDDLDDAVDDALPYMARNELPLRFCDVQGKVHSPISDAYIPMRYHCEGPLYDKFSKELHTFVEDYDAPNLLWGRQGLAANSSTLIVGNSHLQQITETLVCQEDRFGSRLVDITYLDPDIYDFVARRYTFRNGAVIYHAANTYAVHMKDWGKVLADQLGRRLDTFDKVVFGAANSCTPPVKTTFATEMNEFMTQRFGKVCERPEGPNVTDFYDVFPHQSLLYVSMFATYQAHVYRAARRTIHSLSRDQGVDIAFLEARKYIKAMGGAGGKSECGSPRASSVSDCLHGDLARKKYHRCTGTKGSHPDLIAWDIVDFVNS